MRRWSKCSTSVDLFSKSGQKINSVHLNEPWFAFLEIRKDHFDTENAEGFHGKIFNHSLHLSEVVVVASCSFDYEKLKFTKTERIT